MGRRRQGHSSAGQRPTTASCGGCPYTARPQGSCIQHSSAPDHLPSPFHCLRWPCPFTRRAEASQTSLRPYPVFARAAPSTHLPSILFCIITFLWLGERSVTSPPRFPVFSGLWGSPGGGTGRAKTRKELGKVGHWAAHVPPLVLPLSIYTGLCLPGYHPQSPHLFPLTQPLQSL